MKEIKITITDHSPNDMWNAADYPGPGVYEVPQELYNYIAIESNVVYTIPKIIFNSEQSKPVQESGSVQIDDLLKIMAVTRDPKLAKSLTQKD